MTNNLRLKIGEWMVDPTLNLISRDGESRKIQPLSMSILAYMSEQAGIVISQDDLLGRFWPGRVASEDAVYRRIADLRRQLNDDSRKPLYIETVPKRGYRLVAEVVKEITQINHAGNAINGYDERVSVAVNVHGDSHFASILKDGLQGLLTKLSWIRLTSEGAEPTYQYDVKVEDLDSSVYVSYRVSDHQSNTMLVSSKDYGAEPDAIKRADQMSAGLVSILLREITNAERIRVTRLEADQASCWDLCMKIRNDNIDTFAGQREAMRWLELSLTKDRSHAYSHSRLAFLLSYSANTGHQPEDDLRTRAHHHVDQALSLAPEDPGVVNDCVIALIHLGEIERATELGIAIFDYFPVWGFSHVSNVLLERKDYETALRLLNEHRAHHPEPTVMKSREAVAILLLTDHVEEAQKIAATTASLRINSFVDWVVYANTLGHSGKLEEARKAWERATTMANGLTVARWQQAWNWQFRNTEVPQVLTLGLVRAGLR